MKLGRVMIWVPLLVMIGAAVVFATWMSFEKFVTDYPFAVACAFILVMLSPLLVYLITNKLRVTRKTSPFGGGWKVFISTSACTVIVLITNIILSQPTFQVMPWQVYTYYLVISVGEETYYRMVLCWGILALFSCKKRVAGIPGALIVTTLGFTGGFQAETVPRMAWIAASIVIFAIFYIAVGRKEKRVSIVGIIVAIAISAMSFSLAHWNVYQMYPEMILSTFIGGLTMGAFLIATKNPFVPLTAHFCNNLAALRGVIIN